ncbi:hypothetical protein FXO38_01034 [Capsicum annuum]|nr:hypothetical protein FXO38_01034 [Capsicum annuum]
MVPSPCPWCHTALMRSRWVHRRRGAKNIVPSLGCMGDMVRGALVPWFAVAWYLGETNSIKTPQCSELAVQSVGKAPEGTIPSSSPAPPVVNRSHCKSSSCSPPKADEFGTGNPIPIPQSQSFFQSYQSIFPTFLAYIIPSTRGYLPWRPDATMSTIGHGRFKNFNSIYFQGLCFFDFCMVPLPCPWCHGSLMRSRRVHGHAGANHTVPNLGCMGSIRGALVPWCTVPWCLGNMVHVALVPWCVVPWFLGAMVRGVVVPWYTVPWFLGAIVPWCAVPWCYGALAPWCLGSKAPWCMVPWCLGATNSTKESPW